MSSGTAYVNHKILRQVREEYGFSLEKASKNILSSEKLQSVEAGEEYLTFSQLKQIANRYKLPITYFYLNETVSYKIDEKFRSVKSQSIPITPELREAINGVEEKRDLVIEFDKFNETEYDYSFIDSFSLDYSIEKGVDILSRYINREKLKPIWKTDYSVLNSWINEFTRIGILVFQIPSIPVEVMRGFSISKTPFPVIAMNNKDSPLGRVFTLVHEFVHLGLKDDEEISFSLKIEQSAIEKFCNDVSAEILIPKSEILASQTVLNHSTKEIWIEEELNALQKEFKVSKEAVLLRLAKLQYTTNEFYSKKKKEWSTKRKSQKKSSSGPLIHQKVISENSTIFLKTILTAYNEDMFSSSKLSSVLNLKLKHLETLENEFWKKNK